jgi:peptide chain release factor 2
LASVRSQIARLESLVARPDFWADRAKAQESVRRLNNLKKKLLAFDRLEAEHGELKIYIELLQEKKDTEIAREVEVRTRKLDKELAEMRLASMLRGEQDRNNAILFLHSGAGGTESCDWANMLLRMYLGWAQRHKYIGEILHVSPGEEAGIKSTTLLVKGPYAYGYLQAEVGVHRLVRISPFDASRRRHTSFASVFVSPEIDESIEVDIKDKDLRVDTYHASSAGGQHVNVTDSAVRITHLPTGIVVQCQSSRSQHKNKADALNVLRSRLFEYYRAQEIEKLVRVEKGKKSIEWGSQIRSYILHPYQLVKDHRTDLEVGNVDAVLNGDIDQFIDAYLSAELE